MSEKLDGKMSAINWTFEIETIAGPYGGNRKGWLSRAARKSGATFRQVKALYYGECKNPKISVASQIISAADQARIEQARRDATKLANVYQTTAHALGNIDPDFHRGDIDALVHAARILSALDSAGTKDD